MNVRFASSAVLSASFAALALLTSFPSRTSAEIIYRLTDLGGLGGADSRASGINNAGVVVGYAFTPGDEISHAYRYTPAAADQPARIDDLTPTGFISSAATLNDAGLIVGMNVEPASRRARATVWHDGEMTSFNSANHAESLARGVNRSGQVAGDARFGMSRDTPLHAFRSTGAGPTAELEDLGTLGGAMSSGLAINSLGNVVGWSLTAATDWQQRAFLWFADGPNAGTMVDLGTLGGEHSQANALNDQGEVAGWAWREDGVAEAFIYSGPDDNGHPAPMRGLGIPRSSAEDINENGDIVGWWSPDGFERSALVSFANRGGGQTGVRETLDLNTLIDPATGWHLVEATALNDAGWIVGYGVDPDGIDRGFLLTPIPGPGPIVTALIGFVCIANSRRRPH